MRENEWVTVYSAPGRLTAEMIRLLLESFQVPVVLAQESVGGTYGFTIGDLGMVDIQVPANKKTEAIEILQLMEAGTFMLEEKDLENKDAITDDLTKD